MFGVDWLETPVILPVAGAAALAAAPPVALAGVVLIGLPAYPDADTARREIR